MKLSIRSRVALLAASIFAASAMAYSPPPSVATPTSPPRLSAPTVVSTAGDIACGTNITAYNNGNGTATQCRQKYTAALLEGSDAVWTLGDHAYSTATTTQLNAAYKPTWGQYKKITYPTPGDHDYGKIAGKGYFTYFGRPPYYSFDTAGWHVISLNSEIDHSAISEQAAWLEADLASTDAACVAAYWSTPRWTSSKKAPGDATFNPFWETLDEEGADLILAGDAHHYERFAKMNPNGTEVADGVRQFTVGTGGRSLDGFPYVQPTSEKRVKAFGVLQLTLHKTSYDWQFIDESRTVRDSGSAACH